MTTVKLTEKQRRRLVNLHLSLLTLMKRAEYWSNNLEDPSDCYRLETVANRLLSAAKSLEPVIEKPKRKPARPAE